MKILSLFIHPQVVSNLFRFLYSAKHKIRYFDNVGNKAVDFHIYFFLSPYYRSQWLFFLIIFILSKFFKIFFFNRRKKIMAYFLIFKYILYF